MGQCAALEELADQHSLAPCVWDAVKLAAGLLAGNAEAGYLLVAAPLALWQKPILGAQLFESRTWLTGGNDTPESSVAVLCDLARRDELVQHTTDRSILAVALDGPCDVGPTTWKAVSEEIEYLPCQTVSNGPDFRRDVLRRFGLVDHDRAELRRQPNPPRGGFRCGSRLAAAKGAPRRIWVVFNAAQHEHQLGAGTDRGTATVAASVLRRVVKEEDGHAMASA